MDREATVPTDDRALNRRELFWHKVSSVCVLVLRYLFFTRYSWLLGIALIALTPLSLRAFPGMLANLYVLDVPAQVYHVSWIALWCAVAVMETLRVTTLNAQFRFDDYQSSVERFRKIWGQATPASSVEWYKRLDGWFCFGLGLGSALAIWYVIVEACISNTALDPASTWDAYVDPGQHEAMVQALGWREAIKGLCTTLAVLGAVNGAVIGASAWLRRGRKRRAAAQLSLSEATDTQRGGRQAKGVFGLLDSLLGPGYFRRETIDESGSLTQLRPSLGHVGLLFYTVAFLAWYAVNFTTATGPRPMPTETSPYSALFYGLLSLLLITYLLAGFAFYLDRYRIPVSLVILFGTLFLYGSFGTDHYYEPNPPRDGLPTTELTTLTNVYDQWDLPAGRDGRRTLVVVDASGGGIQASAWTAQILTGLHECYGDPMSRSVGLISGVSGGSVGTMYYLIHRGDVQAAFGGEVPQTEVLTSESIDAIRRLSRASALEATAWGVAYPDTMRAVFPPVVGSTIDRGWAIERVWRQRMSDIDGPTDFGDVRVTELGSRSASHQLPVFVFNATLVETGQRLIIAPVRGPPPLSSDGPAAVEFLDVFRQAHPRLSTAARLSATFPYVTPAARAASDQIPEPDDRADRVATYHVVDGGYADNEGAVTSVDWINRLLVHYSRDEHILERPFDHVLLIRIQAFPKQVAYPHNRSALAGWRSALVGPLDAMMSVRVASQTERGDLEVNLLTQATLAQIDANKQRFESEFKLAQARADALEQEAAANETLLRELADQADVAEADVVRRMRSARDRVSAAQSIVDDAAEKRGRIAKLTVASVLFDFRPPENSRIPLSWKLTDGQKRNIDAAWQRIRDQEPTHPALTVMDRYFARKEQR